jgi:hypothetical protein
MAAGLGFKTFTTGEVLTAADTNGYLMQGVLVFADAAARDAAITAPAEGQFAYTKDVNGLWYYDGAAWVASGATGDIEGVTAGTGISGGGTSGTVTITNSMATAIDAKGDLIGGTGADAFSRLAVGADGTQLVADSAEATGLKWATPGAAGKVLQVVSATYGTEVTTTSGTFADTGLTLAITPSLNTSKVLILISQHYTAAGSSGDGIIGNNILRGATSIFANTYGVIFNMGSTNLGGGNWGYTFLDSPATTSATTYKTQFRRVSGSGTQYSNFGSATSTITLLEIGA